MRWPAQDGPVLAMMTVQVTVWAGLFYSFPALVLHWQAEFDWTMPELMGAFTLAISVYALGLPVYGRLIDRGLAPVSFPAGALAGALLLIGLGFVETRGAFYALWAAIGVTMGLTLYEPCFALVTRARGNDARRAITAITLVGGFASTLAYPLTAAVAGWAGWRAALAVLAGLIVVLALPLARWAATRLEAEAATRAGPATPARAARRRRLVTDRRYWPLAAGFALAALTSGIFLSHLLPIMAAQGVPERTAILAAALVGPAQVAGRVLMMLAWTRASAIGLAQAAMLTLTAGALFLAGSTWAALLVVGFALCQGAGYGVVGILRPVVTREAFGQREFGAVSGAVSAPALLVFALAPYLGASLVPGGGYGPVLALGAAAPVAGAALLAVSARQIARAQA